MISFTSNFKNIVFGYIKTNAAFITALTVILIAETFVFMSLKDQHISKTIDKNSLLKMNFSYQDSSSRYVIGYKNNGFDNFDADILMVGDSSGFINVQPLIVNQYLKNHKLINFSHSITTRWDGYLAIAENQLKKNQHLRYLLIYMSPNSIPFVLDKKATDDETHLKNLYASRWVYLYQIPSLYFRKDLVTKIYQYGESGGEPYLNQSIKRISNGSYDNYERFLIDNLGWVPSSIYRENIDVNKINSAACDHNLLQENQKPELYKLLKKAKNLADSYKVKLIIAFAPLACTASESTDDVFAQFKLFQQQNPEIYILNNFINTKPVANFIDDDHLNIESSKIYSEEFAMKLETILE